MGATNISYNLKRLVLTNEEKYFVQACLLGDGTLSTSGQYHRLRVAHKLAHTDYVLLKFGYLKRLCVSGPAVDKTNNSLRFGTVGHREISQLKNLWYVPVKQVPKNFRLNGISLAIWFMDDGGKVNNTVSFSVHNYSLKSIILLQKMLLKMNVRTKIQSDGKGKRLYVNSASYPTFKKFVSPYILPCMAYKLP